MRISNERVVWERRRKLWTHIDERLALVAGELANGHLENAPSGAVCQAELGAVF